MSPPSICTPYSSRSYRRVFYFFQPPSTLVELARQLASLHCPSLVWFLFCFFRSSLWQGGMHRHVARLICSTCCSLASFAWLLVCMPRSRPVHPPPSALQPFCTRDPDRRAAPCRRHWRLHPHPFGLRAQQQRAQLPTATPPSLPLLPSPLPTRPNSCSWPRGCATRVSSVCCTPASPSPSVPMRAT